MREREREREKGVKYLPFSEEEVLLALCSTIKPASGKIKIQGAEIQLEIQDEEQDRNLLNHFEAPNSLSCHKERIS